MKVTVRKEIETSWKSIAAHENSTPAILKTELQSGDIVHIELKNGRELALDFGRDETGKGFFIFRDCLGERAMNRIDTNTGGWEKSDMRRYANEEFIYLLPDDLQEVIKPTKIVQIIDGERRETMDKLFCMSMTQMFGKGYWSDEEPEDTQIDIFKTERDRVKNLNGKTWWYWLRSADSGSATNFRNVNIGGAADYTGASGSYGVCFGFCV